MAALLVGILTKLSCPVVVLSLVPIPKEIERSLRVTLPGTAYREACGLLELLFSIISSTSSGTLLRKSYPVISSR